MGTHDLEKKHAFAICAYGKNPYLEQCIDSILNQTVRSCIRIFTSTPNEHISGLAEKYGLPLCINMKTNSIASDWNFAYEQTDAKMVTLAHQDDVYYPDFLKHTIEHIELAKDPVIAFTAYNELYGQRIVSEKDFVNLRIKGIMLAPLSVGKIQGIKWIRRRILSFGNPICCPSVTFVKENLPKRIFDEGMSTNLDWAAWEKLSSIEGRFIYIPQALMAHRIYEDSTTGTLIRSGVRSREDLKMLNRFWPAPLAKAINTVYSKSQNSRVR